MIRKAGLLIAFGTLCIVTGRLDPRLAADECANSEPDFDKHCAVDKSDDPNGACGNVMDPTTCNKYRLAKDQAFNTGASVTKYSKGNYSQIVLSGSWPFEPLTSLCYNRIYCKYDDTNKKCVDDKKEPVWQNVHKKWTCPPTEG